ncbi:hypothetical protein AOLI_G00250870 [Acnodon oligacanthus]
MYVYIVTFGRSEKPSPQSSPALRPLSCGGAAAGAPVVRCGCPPLALRKAVPSAFVRPISTERKWRTKCGGDRVVDTADSQITFVMCTDQDLL